MSLRLDLSKTTTPSSHEHKKGCFCRNCGTLTHLQKTQLMALALSILPKFNLREPLRKEGQASRLIAVAEACKINGLPSEVAAKVMALVEPTDMFRWRFPQTPGEQRWFSGGDQDRIEAANEAREQEARRKRKDARAAARAARQ